MAEAATSCLGRRGRVRPHRCCAQTLRSSSQPLPAWECMRASLETALSLEGGEAEVPLAPLPLPHTQGHPAAREMLPWRPCRTGLTAGQAPWRFAEPEACRTWRAEARPSAPSHRGQRQAIGGVVLLAGSDTQPVEAPTPPAALRPVKGLPVVTDRVARAPARRFATAHDRPSSGANPLQAGSGGRPGLPQAGVRAAAPTLAGRAASLSRTRVLRGATFPPHPPTRGAAARPYTGCRSRLEKPPARPASAAATGGGSPVWSRMRAPLSPTTRGRHARSRRLGPDPARCRSRGNRSWATGSSAAATAPSRADLRAESPAVR
jgi:hypothetical protein